MTESQSSGEKIVEETILRKINAGTALRTAFVERLTELPDDQDLHDRMMYYWRVWDNPILIEMDVKYLDQKLIDVRNSRTARAKLSGKVKAGIGSLAAMALTSLLALFGLK